MNQSKEYHKTTLHERLLKNIALNVELLYNDKDYEISEYDIQATMAKFLKGNFINTNFSINRERFGKFDCVISNKTSKKPSIIYEIKTFAKPYEELNKGSVYDDIMKDFKKLKLGIQMYKHSRGYFILICKKRDVENVSFLDQFDFIRQHIDNSREWITKTKLNLKLRPSRKIEIERVVALSWEIK